MPRASFRDLALRPYWRLERALVPGIQYSQSSYEDVLRGRLDGHAAWLDLGCGRRILPSWRSDAERALVAKCEQLVGVDADRHSLKENGSVPFKCQASIGELPFADATFDLVTANMVVEHLDAPAEQFREIARVMRSRGLFILHTPNAFGYATVLARAIPDAVRRHVIRILDGRRDSDVFPAFYKANTRRTLERLARENALAVEEFRLVLTTAIFAVVLPIAFLELLWLRLLRIPQLAWLRPNIIAVLRKVDGPAGSTVVT